MKTGNQLSVEFLAIISVCFPAAVAPALVPVDVVPARWSVAGRPGAVAARCGICFHLRATELGFFCCTGGAGFACGWDQPCEKRPLSLSRPCA